MRRSDDVQDERGMSRAHGCAGVTMFRMNGMTV
jgi:hypothetical protein